MQDKQRDTNVSFRVLESESADAWALRLERMKPWSKLKTSHRSLGQLLRSDRTRIESYEILMYNEVVGVIAIQPEWLIGPYLKLLAIFEEHQGQGLGSTALRWFEERNSINNAWLCVSEFNHRARIFYESHGYLLVGRLDGLILRNETELLYRKAFGWP